MRGWCNEPTGCASPSGDVAKVVVGQELAGGREGTQLDVRVQSGLGGQTQQGNVIPELVRKLTVKHCSQHLTH